MQSASLLTEAISKAVAILRSSPSLNDEGTFRALISRGISRNIAARVVEFLPMAYCRLVLEASGARFTDSFVRRSEDGSLKEYPLSSEPVWRASTEFARAEVRQGVSAQDLLSIATRSAEFQAANQLLRKGSKLENIAFTVPLLNWPEQGPDFGG